MTKLHKNVPSISPQCHKWFTEEATLLHCYALCPKLIPFLPYIFKTLSDMLHTELKPDPLLIMLGVSD